MSEMNASTGRTRLRQAGGVLADLPAFLTSPIYRRWHLRWGTVPEEVQAPMPGDDRFATAQFRATRAITIKAPPELVWPWLVQMGCLRAGWYSHDLLDNLGRPSATTLDPALQDLQVGQWVPMSPKPPPTEKTAVRVDSFEVERWLLWTKPDSTWSWRLNPYHRRRHAARQPHPCGLRLATSHGCRAGCGADGDGIVEDPKVVTDHAITIDAPPSAVWPWLVQMGWGRGGWYTARWVDRLLFPANAPSADRIIPELQDIDVGTFIPDGPPHTECGLIVEQIEHERALVLHSTSHLPNGWRAHATLDWSWAFVLGLRPDTAR